tara:strand:+ start:208030 stop:209649 length:1620 start_codon:yes stop_codon:yes gene_type:complete
MMGDSRFGTFSHLRAFAMSTVPILIADDDCRNIVIDRPAIVVGRSRRRSDVRIDDRSISAVHCEIEVDENCLRVRNRGRNGIRINGQKRDEGVLYDGDVFEIARLKFRVLMEGDPRHPNASQLSCSNDWFVRLAGMELGPMPWAELSLMAQRGELTESDEVRWSRQRQWRSAATTDGLFDTDSNGAKPIENPAAPATLPVIAAQPVGKFVDGKMAEQGGKDDQSWTGKFQALEDSEESSIDDREEIDVESRIVDLETGDESDNDNENKNEWRPGDAPAEHEARVAPLEPSLPGQTETILPPLPVARSLPDPPPVRVAVRPAPYQPLPTPKIGRSDTMLDVIYDSVLEPVLGRVPLLKSWLIVVTVVAGLAIAVLMMLPSYEGAEVSGRVTLNGKPLANATISFTNLENGFGASAIAGSDGTFEVITLKGGMQPGTYSIAVIPQNPESPEVASETQRHSPQASNGGSRDGKSLTGEGDPGYRPDRSAKESDEEAIQFPASTIPFKYQSILTSDLSKEITEDGPNELLIELTQESRISNEP